MRAWCLVLVHAIGCAQLAGIEPTTGRDADIDSPPPMPDAAPDARVCAGGDARVTDPTTGACYTFFTTPMTRNNARAACAALGASVVLASIQSASENQVIATLVGTSVAFVGGNDEVTEGMFKWEDGSAVVLTNWNTGEPNNGAGTYEEDCIVINGALAGKWDDRPCAPGPVVAGAYPFVCEQD
jgi:hypothetical protein